MAVRLFLERGPDWKPKKGITHIYRGADGFRWRSIANRGGKIVAASTEGMINRKDCINSAFDYGPEGFPVLMDESAK